MEKCNRCKEFYLSPLDAESCRCKKFTIVNEDDDDYEVWANDEWLAALKYAETSNEENEYYLMDESVDISVNGKAYRVSAEPDVHYSAKVI